MEIRRATDDDLESIRLIYNEAVVSTTATFDTEPRTTAAQSSWFAGHDRQFPVFVAIHNEVVSGWACLSRWSDRPAYQITAEASFYVGTSWQGQGIGKQLCAALIEHARQAGFHSLLARVADGSRASLKLCQSAGFQEVGVMREVGKKFDRLLDVHLLQLML